MAILVLIQGDDLTITPDIKDYVEKNTGWPKRTESCDKSS